MSKTIEEAVYDAIKPLLYENEFVADKNNPHFLDRWYEQSKAAEWGANFALSHQWRSVEDELPEKNGFYVVLSHGELRTAYWWYDGWCNTEPAGDWDYNPIKAVYGVTHFMPIPSLNPEQQ
ncbi:MAG: DUF551 domain-containing protein [Bacteroidales bacterium]|nr:DUF551 domain-containing protein [Bacteroidales bacterium]